LGAGFAVPVWLVALVLAAAAPLLVSGIQALVVRRARERTLALIERSKTCDNRDSAAREAARRRA
jgi:hypothetical protein